MSKRYSLAEQKIRSIGEIARLIHSEDDLDTLLEQVNHGISRHSVWALSSIVAVDFTEGRTYLVSTSSPYGTTDDPAYSDRSWHISDSPSAQAVQSEEMIIIEDAQNQDRSPGYRQQARDLGYRTLVIVPIGAVDDHGRPLVLSLKARDITEVSQGVVAMYGGGVVVLVPECAARKLGDANIRRQFWNDVQWTFGDEALIVQCDTCRIIEDYQLSYAQGEKIVKLASSLRLAGWINRQDLRSSIVLLSLADDKIVSAFLENGIRRIVDHDRQHHTDYFVTLKAFVEHEGRFQSSAEALGLHPTTLRYRISRLEELFGIDATTAATRFELQLAIKLLELGSMRVQQT